MISYIKLKPSVLKAMMAIQALNMFLFCIILSFFEFGRSGYLSILPPGCDTEAALQCEYDFLLCKLFNGPANDKQTLCTCASDFYGGCLRKAGVSGTVA